MKCLKSTYTVETKGSIFNSHTQQKYAKTNYRLPLFVNINANKR